MSPAAASTLDGFLEHPSSAFDEYAAEGVASVVCEEKHMGSRAIVVVCRDEEVAARRFGISGEGPGVVYTRTGRAFFQGQTGADLVDRAREAFAPLFDSLESDWLVVDCELLPWSAKAMGLIRDQYAAVGAASRVVLPAASSLLSAAAARGLDVSGIAERTARRTEDAAAYRAAYAAYCRPTSGLDGVTLAPFQVLACEGRTPAVEEGHPWHLDVLGGLDHPLLTPTRHVVVDLASATSREAAIEWWSSLTAAGGEGMVVKPTSPAKGRVQPGLKVRGREYLRIIYGPDYTASLDLLRNRNLGKKKGLAVREHALGIEALTRFVAGEPLWRVHQAVFGVLALESEPVDPRL
jgi:hypothetical protein